MRLTGKQIILNVDHEITEKQIILDGEHAIDRETNNFKCRS